MIGNINEFKSISFIERFKFNKLEKEIQKFQEILIEGTFLIRAMFFLLFGFLIKTDELLNPKTFYWAAGIVGLIFIIRLIQLKISRLPLMPLVFFAPRGLITILLFLYIVPADRIDLVNESLIIQVIILSVIVMMIGMIFNKKKDEITNKKKVLHSSEFEFSNLTSGLKKETYQSVDEFDVNSQLKTVEDGLSDVDDSTTLDGGKDKNK